VISPKDGDHGVTERKKGKGLSVTRFRNSCRKHTIRKTWVTGRKSICAASKRRGRRFETFAKERPGENEREMSLRRGGRNRADTDQNLLVW